MRDSLKPVRLFVGADAQNVQRRRLCLIGDRCFSGAYGPKSRFLPDEAPQVNGLLDSGAFSDSPPERLSPSAALERQLAWERNAERFWKWPWRAEAIVSYDLLIDEKWDAKGCRRKSRWSVAEADVAVRVTVDAAGYLSSQRERLSPRRLVLACQGVDAIQYEECVRGVLAHTSPDDWIGLGGWCILGTMRTWLPTFWQAMRLCLPLVATRASHVHVFGVLWQPALGGLLWLCDQLGLSLSTDSSGPVLQCTFPDRNKSGRLCDTWEENVARHQALIVGLRSSTYYREPPLDRQRSLFAPLVTSRARSGNVSPGDSP